MIRHSLLHDRRGSFTLEASLVYPVIFYALIILLFFCMYLYQTAVLGQAAGVAAERAAYSWDNSYRNSRTGAYEAGKYDSLYWRLTDDGLLQGLFGWGASSNDNVNLQLPVNTQADGALPLKKLARTGGELPSGLSGEMTYDNSLLSRKVSVLLHCMIPLVPLEKVLGDVEQYGRSDSYIVEPVEWIRTVELARYYGAKFQGRAGAKTDKQEAGKALQMYGK